MSDLSIQQAYLVLNALPNIGPISLNRILAEVGGDPCAVFQASARQLEAVPRVGPAAIGSIRNWKEHFDLAREEARMAKAGVTFVTPADPDYPPMLKEIHDPPIGLYRRGSYDFSRRCLAIVGSRRTTLYGQATAKRLARDLTERGFTIVSGLARGIDTAAHEGAIESGAGPTAAILGTGIDIVYPPENLGLFRRIEETGGAVLSEFPFGRRADKQSFAMRNRIVSGICEAVLVVESDVSGGAMITARFAGEQGRQLFAVPGRIDQPSSAGCHQLIRDGATLLTGIDDLLSELKYLDGMQPALVALAGAKSSERPDLGDDEGRVFDCFTGGAMLTPDALLASTGLDSSQVSVALMRLELRRLVAKRADGTYESRRV